MNEKQLELRLYNIESQLSNISNVLKNVLFYLGYEKNLRDLRTYDDKFRATINEIQHRQQK